MKRFPYITRRAYLEGHCIANHTMNHFKLTDNSVKDFMSNINGTEKVIDSICGSSSKLFRPPWGLMTKEQKDSLYKYGYKIILWDIDSKDYSKRFSPEMIILKVISSVKKNNIILFHDSDYTCKESRIKTVKALPGIIDFLKKEGYVFVKATSLLDYGKISFSEKEILL